MRGRIQLDPCIWQGHSIEVVDKGSSQKEVPDEDDLQEDRSPYMVTVSRVVLVFL